MTVMEARAEPGARRPSRPLSPVADVVAEARGRIGEEALWHRWRQGRRVTTVVDAEVQLTVVSGCSRVDACRPPGFSSTRDGPLRRGHRLAVAGAQVVHAYPAIIHCDLVFTRNSGTPPPSCRQSRMASSRGGGACGFASASNRKAGCRKSSTGAREHH